MTTELAALNAAQASEITDDAAAYADFRRATGQEAGPANLAEGTTVVGRTYPDFTSGDFLAADDDGIDASNVDPADGYRTPQRSRLGRHRPSQALLGAVETDGMGFRVERFSNPDLPEVCRFCGDRLLSPAEQYPCELATDEPPVRAVGANPDMPFATVIDQEYQGPCISPDCPKRHGGKSHDGGCINGRVVLTTEPILPRLVLPDRSPRPDMSSSCRCNGCERRRLGNRAAGGQRRVCQSDDCRKALRREQNQRAKRRRDNEHRARAAEGIRANPDMSDRDIATELGIPAVRVREARNPSS